MQSQGELSPGNLTTERSFHIVMGGLLAASFLLDQKIQDMRFWNPPLVSVVSLVLGLVWVGRYAWTTRIAQEQQQRVLRDRIERLERRLASLEPAESRHRPPLDLPPFDPGRQRR